MATTANQHALDKLNSLLRGAMSATETYEQAINKLVNYDEVAQLRRIHAEHSEAVDLFRTHVIEHGGEASTGSGAWGWFAQLVEGTAKLFGPGTALAALKRGEEHGLKEYTEGLEDASLPQDCRDLIQNKLLPRQREHLATLDNLIARVAS